MSGRRPLHILGRLRPNLCHPTSCNSPQNPPKDQVFPWHNSDPHRVTTSISTVAPSANSAQRSSSHTTDRRSPVPVHPQLSLPQFHRDPRLLDVAMWLLSGISSDSTTSMKQQWKWQLIPSETHPVMCTIPSERPLPCGQMISECSPRTSNASGWQIISFSSLLRINE